LVGSAQHVQAQPQQVPIVIGPEAHGAWRELETRLRPFVARRLRGAADVDDVLQDIFVRMHRGMSGLRDGERFGGWVYRIAEHAVADHLRSRARQPFTAETGDGELHANAELDPRCPSLEAELSECVALFVSRLAPPYRHAITLTELEGLTQQAGAELLGLSLSGMKSRVQRGREQLRRMFEECCEISLDARGRVLDCAPRPLAEIPEDCRSAAACWAARRPS
jgi:RNA polymerase sigma-70 factor (ECF subfamily)